MGISDVLKDFSTGVASGAAQTIKEEGKDLTVRVNSTCRWRIKHSLDLRFLNSKSRRKKPPKKLTGVGR